MLEVEQVERTAKMEPSTARVVARVAARVESEMGSASRATLPYSMRSVQTDRRERVLGEVR
jgi:hypothetical protein